jgi:type II secretory pathway predicted ATPase ExeA
MNFDEHIDKLINITEKIAKLEGVVMLTGRNGSGKSFIRSLLPTCVRHHLELVEGILTGKKGRF